MTDALTSAALFLADHVEWMRHRPECEDFLADIQAAHRVMTGLIDGAPPRHYLGPCGMQLTAAVAEWDGHVCTPGATSPGQIVTPATYCDGDVYAREGASNGRCRTCGAEVSVQDRRAWLDETVRSTAHRAAHIADAYRINVNTIRTWHLRGKLFPARKALSDGEQGPLELTYDHRGRPLFNVGEVLELARQDAERRAANEAKRAQREEVAA